MLRPKESFDDVFDALKMSLLAAVLSLIKWELTYLFEINDNVSYNKYRQFNSQAIVTLSLSNLTFLIFLLHCKRTCMIGFLLFLMPAS